MLSGAEEVVEALPSPLAGVGAVVSAGGTREPIDPVRYVGNRSSGKQGYAVASELAGRGARVVLVSTVTATLPDPAGVTVVAVETAAEMESAVMSAAAGAQVVVMAAAVADFRPKASADSKLKKSDGPPEVVLEPTTDILAALGGRRGPGQVLVGFAAETPLAREPEQSKERLRTYAREKLVSKGVDLVVANDVAAPGVGFAHDTNAVLIVCSDGEEIDVPLSSKQAVAAAVADAIESRLAPEADSVSERRGEVRSAEHSQEKA